MRLLLVFIMLLALPVLVLAHRQFYFMSIQGPLLVQVSMALDKPEFAQVETSMTYADVALEGLVAGLPLREQARALVDGIRGVRCREQDNHLLVPAKLAATLNGSDLSLTGWLHDEALLRDATAWIEAMRPGLMIDTSDVQFSPYVTVEEPPQSGKDAPRFLRPVWSAIEVPASLRIMHNQGAFTASGFLPSQALVQAVASAISDANAGTAVEAKRLRAGSYVRPAPCTDEHALPEFLRVFFRSPAAREFEADAKGVRVAGTFTPSGQREWMPLIEKLAKGAKLTADIQVFPSPYHFPGYTPESDLSAEAITVLRNVLGACTIRFEAGVSTPAAAEQPKLAAASAAIIAAGPGARVIVGAHMDVAGEAKTNETMARRRAESVVADLAGRGVPPHCLEAAAFDTVPAGEDRSRRVELLVK